MSKVPPGYYLGRLYETARSWYYWFVTPYEELSVHGGSYHPNSINWGVIMGDETIMSNFWFMVNDGYYDNFDEWYDKRR